MTKLALIGVDGITSGPPGGTLTFTGLDLLALGTVNGSINLTSDISFQDISVLAMYARGAGSNLILDSPISNIGDLKLGAEGSIQLTNPGTMNVGQFDATAGDDLTLQIGGSLLLNGKVRLDASFCQAPPSPAEPTSHSTSRAITRTVRLLSFLVWPSRTRATSARVEILL